MKKIDITGFSVEEIKTGYLLTVWNREEKVTFEAHLRDVQEPVWEMVQDFLRKAIMFDKLSDMMPKKEPSKKLGWIQRWIAGEK